jgi:hypothetical protein
VLQLRNDYDLKVYNGDLGTVRSVDPAEQVLDIVLHEGREVCYPYASAYALTHAYAATVHKVQGSEFPAVVIVLLTSHATMLGRTLVYTHSRAPGDWRCSWARSGRSLWRSATGDARRGRQRWPSCSSIAFISAGPMWRGARLWLTKRGGLLDGPAEPAA